MWHDARHRGSPFSRQWLNGRRGIAGSSRQQIQVRRCGADLEFKVHAIVSVSFLIDTPDVMFCRFLLTHLRSPGEVLDAWTHHGQRLQVGAVLEDGFAGSGWRLVESQRRLLEKPAGDMAELHLANLRTWRDDEYAQRAFDSDEIAALEISLGRIASRREDGGLVFNAARQMIAQRG
jgi:hypothetical protein